MWGKGYVPADAAQAASTRPANISYCPITALAMAIRTALDAAKQIPTRNVCKLPVRSPWSVKMGSKNAIWKIRL